MSRALARRDLGLPRSPSAWSAPVVALIVTLACTPDPAADRVYRLMQCQECIAGEEAAVIALGDSAAPLLRELLLRGPPAAHVRSVERTLQRLTQRAPLGRRPSPATIAAQLDDVRAIYRSRAARALGAIGTPASRQGLCAARGASFPRADVRRSVDDAIARLGMTCP